MDGLGITAYEAGGVVVVGAVGEELDFQQSLLNEVNWIWVIADLPVSVKSQP